VAAVTLILVINQLALDVRRFTWNLLLRSRMKFNNR
jgi:hypothetical protein